MTNYNPVILPMIRSVRPDIIAADIIGAQPMSAPTEQVVDMMSSLFPGMLETFDGRPYMPYTVMIMT